MKHFCEWDGKDPNSKPCSQDVPGDSPDMLDHICKGHAETKCDARIP